MNTDHVHHKHRELLYQKTRLVCKMNKQIKCNKAKKINAKL